MVVLPGFRVIIALFFGYFLAECKLTDTATSTLSPSCNLTNTFKLNIIELKIQEMNIECATIKKRYAKKIWAVCKRCVSTLRAGVAVCRNFEGDLETVFRHSWKGFYRRVRLPGSAKNSSGGTKRRMLGGP